MSYRLRSGNQLAFIFCSIFSLLAAAAAAVVVSGIRSLPAPPRPTYASLVLIRGAGIPPDPIDVCIFIIGQPINISTSQTQWSYQLGPGGGVGGVRVQSSFRRGPNNRIGIAGTQRGN